MGGYSGNLFADSFSIGSSYLLSNVSISSTHFKTIRLKFYYDIYYTNYDTDNIINNVFHVPGLSLYGKSRDNRLKAGISGFLTSKDYINGESGFDYNRFFGIADASYYLGPGFQIKSLYKFTRSQYINFGSLDNIEHAVEAELVATLPTRSTFRGLARYAVRQFDEDNITFHWFDTELGLSQSLNQKTGVSLAFRRRWSVGGTRPLSTYNIISGITSFWDPWKGNQADLSLKRILPFAILGKTDISYWNRYFFYDPVIRNQFWWLRNSPDRRDEGWMVKAETSKQFNSVFIINRALKVNFIGGYSSNGSTDTYYDFDGFFAQSRIDLQIF